MTADMSKPGTRAQGGNEGLNSENIGNYKGVMLCNRPNQPGEIRKKERY